MVYRATSLRSLGMIQIFLGVLMVVFGIAAMAAVHHWSSFSACGLWIGIWVILTGLFGYLGSKSDDRPNNCLIGLMIGFTATACVFTAIMFIIYCVALSEFSTRIHCGEDGRGDHIDCYLYDQDYISYDLAKAGAGIGSILLVLALIEFFVALASSIYGCNATCCGVTAPSAGVVQAHAGQQVTYLNQAGQNVTVLSATQGAVLPTGGAATVQTYTAYSGQPTVIQTGHPQVVHPVGVGVQTYQTSYPVQPAVPNVQQQGYFAPPPPYSGGPPQQ